MPIFYKYWERTNPMDTLAEYRGYTGDKWLVDGAWAYGLICPDCGTEDAPWVKICWNCGYERS